MEAYAPAVLFGGLAFAAVAWIWLIARAFGQTFWWGLGSLLVPPLALLFALRHAQKAVAPLVLVVCGGLAAAVPPLYSLVTPSGTALREKLSHPPQFATLAWDALRSDAAHEWMEDRAIYLELGGLALAALAWIWLIARGFQQDRRWGLSVLLLPPFGGLAFVGRHPRRGLAPLLLLLVSLLAAAAPALYTLGVPLDLGPLEKQVDGRRHITLTGWDRQDYGLLLLKPDVVVLQMANPDVTDQVLASLRGMNQLEELDLNDTQVTDSGLRILKDLPALSALRLARTKITDQGFREMLMAKDSLMMLDLRGTEVSQETVRAWREAKPGRKAP
jgi:hypothetical protein